MGLSHVGFTYFAVLSEARNPGFSLIHVECLA